MVSKNFLAIASLMPIIFSKPDKATGGGIAEAETEVIPTPRNQRDLLSPDELARIDTRLQNLKDRGTYADLDATAKKEWDSLSSQRSKHFNRISANKMGIFSRTFAGVIQAEKNPADVLALDLLRAIGAKFKRTTGVNKEMRGSTGIELPFYVNYLKSKKDLAKLAAERLLEMVDAMEGIGSTDMANTAAIIAGYNPGKQGMLNQALTEVAKYAAQSTE